MEALYEMSKRGMRFVAMVREAAAAEKEIASEVVKEMMRRTTMVIRGQREGLESVESLMLGFHGRNTFLII